VDIKSAEKEVREKVYELMKVMRENKYPEQLRTDVAEALNDIDLSDTKSIDYLKEKCKKVKDVLNAHVDRKFKDCK
jgi:hypothetical protein